MTCPSAGSPVEFSKCDFVSPISLAYLFISLAKASSEPEIPSARMMQASLPDCTVTPRIRSSTLTVELSGANMAELPDGAPPVRQACSLTLNWSSSLI